MSMVDRKYFNFPNIFTKKRLIIIAIVLAGLGVGYYYFFANTKKIPLEIATVSRQEIRQSVSASGVLAGKSTNNLRFKSSGKLAYLNVKSGDIASKGAVIARLDTQDLNITLQQTWNTLRDKQAIVDKVHDDVKDHDKDETFTQKQSRTTAEVAKDNAFDEVKKAQRAFQDAIIFSPISGVVTKADIVPGQIVASSDIIAQIVDISEKYFDTDIDEADIGKISPVLVAEVTLDAYPGQTFYGNVDQILPVTKTTSSGAAVVTTRIKLLNFPDNFVAGLNGQASIIIDEKTDVLVIPQEALKSDNSVIIQNKNGRLEQKKVEIGISSDTDIEIISGLQEGEQVVKNPPAQINGNSSPNPLNRVLRMFRGGR